MKPNLTIRVRFEHGSYHASAGATWATDPLSARRAVAKVARRRLPAEMGDLVYHETQPNVWTVFHESK